MVLYLFKMMLLVLHETLDELRSSPNSFLSAKPTKDGRNLFVSSTSSRAHPSSFVGVLDSRTVFTKVPHDFILNLENLSLCSHSETFIADLIMVFDNEQLFERFIDGYTEDTPERDVTESSEKSSSSYLEHHSALFKLVVIFRCFKFSRILLLLILIDWTAGFLVGPYLSTLWPGEVEHSVSRVRHLVSWLRQGSPLGVKLNPQVNQALAKFFSCHVNMWIIYLDVLLPSLRWVTIQVLPCLPASLQFSLVCDLITLSTVHVYCFYGYMCKIYAVWLSSLLALLRIFRGKKLNPLRNRVDSLVGDVEPVLLGPVILTAAIFLLPTILLYYVVFSLIRCCVLVVNFLLGTLVHRALRVVYDVLESLDKPATFSLSSVRLERYGQALRMKVTPSRGTMRLLYSAIANIVRPSEIANLVRDLCVGKIVYPL